MNDNIVIKLENVNKTFRFRDYKLLTIRDNLFNIFNHKPKRVVNALKNINLEIKKGEFFGIIGRNGSGKSTLLKLMTGVYPPDKGGKSFIKGRYMRLTLGLGFNPELSARQNIYTNASIMGLSFKKIGEKFQEIIEFAELEEFVDTKIKYFSSGMVTRLSFSIAIHAEADIFLMDEYFGGVGDIKFQEKASKIFHNAFIDGRTIIHVSHDLDTIREYCDRVLLLHKGEAIAIGKPDEVIDEYYKILN